MSLVNKSQIILAALAIILHKNPRENMKPPDWIKLLLYAFDKNYLYLGWSGGKLARIAIAYRTDDVQKARNNQLPDKEQGDKLFVLIYVNIVANEYDIYQLIEDYFLFFKEVNEIAFETRGDQLKIFKREDTDGREVKEDRRASAEVPD